MLKAQTGEVEPLVTALPLRTTEHVHEHPFKHPPEFHPLVTADPWREVAEGGPKLYTQDRIDSMIVSD